MADLVSFRAAMGDGFERGREARPPTKLPHGEIEEIAGMKLSHAAALAVIGWNLMMPPVNNGQSDTQAPISAWTVFRFFDSAAACKESKLRLETRRGGLEGTVRALILCA